VAFLRTDARGAIEMTDQLICQYKVTDEKRGLVYCGEHANKCVIFDSQVVNFCNLHYQGFRDVIVDIRVHYSFDKFKYVLGELNDTVV
jgi:hypothetical protein